MVHSDLGYKWEMRQAVDVNSLTPYFAVVFNSSSGLLPEALITTQNCSYESMTNTLWGNSFATPSNERPDQNPTAFLDSIANQFRSIGAEHLMITGLPLPGRDLGKLVLLQQWGASEMSSPQLAHIRGNDVLLRRIAVLDKPTRWNLSEEENSWILGSSLVQHLQRSAVDPRSFRTLVGIHIHHFSHLQIAICLAGEEIKVSQRDLCSMAFSFKHELAEMHSVTPILSSRPGELSGRERLVLSMTAEGKTAGDIAEELQISQRTVHAHLQNASEKMQAANKTQTVVEAMRYGQIQLR